MMSRISSRFHLLGCICGPSTKSQRLHIGRGNELVLAKPSHHLFPLRQQEGTDLAAEKYKRLFLLLIQGQPKPFARQRRRLRSQALGYLVESFQPRGASPPPPGAAPAAGAPSGDVATGPSLTRVMVTAGIAAGGEPASPRTGSCGGGDAPASALLRGGSVMPPRMARAALGEAEGVWESNRVAPEPGKPVSRH